MSAPTVAGNREQLVPQPFLAGFLSLLLLCHVDLLKSRQENLCLLNRQLRKQLLAEIVAILVNEHFSQLDVDLSHDLINKCRSYSLDCFLQFLGSVLSHYLVDDFALPDDQRGHKRCGHSSVVRVEIWRWLSWLVEVCGPCRHSEAKDSIVHHRVLFYLRAHGLLGPWIHHRELASHIHETMVQRVTEDGVGLLSLGDQKLLLAVGHHIEVLLVRLQNML
jgi:hypothetical protein